MTEGNGTPEGLTPRADRPGPRPARLATDKDKRRFAALLLIVIAFLGYAGSLETFFVTLPLGDVEKDVITYLDASETKAVEAFAAARAINAAVSVLKSADLSVFVAQIAPMEVLEPVDDLAKQFSDVMVVSIIAILVQRLILMVSQTWAFAVVLPTGCVLLAIAMASARSSTLSFRLAGAGRGLIMLALFARLVILAAGFVGESVTAQFLTNDMDTTMAALRIAGGNIDQVTQKVITSEQDTAAQNTPPDTSPSDGVADPASQSALDRLSNAFKTTTATTRAIINRGGAIMRATQGWMPDMATIRTLVTGLPDRMVKAIEIFLVQTLITPLSVALVFYGVLRWAIRPGYGIPGIELGVRAPVAALTMPA